MRTLRSLGYLSGGTSKSERGVEEASDFWSARAGLKRRALVGEMLYYLIEGDEQAASELAQIINRLSPRLLRHVRHQLSTETQLLEGKIGKDLIDDALVEIVFEIPMSDQESQMPIPNEDPR